MTVVAVDTSAAVPYLMVSHTAHRLTRRHLKGDELVLTQHSLVESYSVLTRLPGDARLAPADAVTLLRANFGDTAMLPPAAAATVPEVFAPLGIAGGATYDALVALCAREHNLPLVTRDTRAAATYVAIGVDVDLIADPSP
jgi:predicted nucleic acid-binding protein